MLFPVYNGQEIAPSVRPSAEMDMHSIARRLPSAMGETFGQDLESASQGAAEIYHQANTTRLEDTINTAVRPFQQNMIQGYQALKGKNALSGPDGKSDQPMPDQLMNQFDSQMSKVRADLANDQQRQMFDQAVSRIRLETHGQVQAHFNQQMQAYQVDTNNATMETETNHIGSVGFANGQLDNASVEQSVQRIGAAVDANAKVLGWSPERTQAAKLDATTKAYTTVLGSMLQADKPDSAETYYQVHKDQIDPGVGARIEKMIQAGVMNQQVNTAIDNVWATKGPKLAGDEVNLEAMSKDIRDQFKDRSEAQKLALSFLKERAQEHDYTMKQQDEQITGGIWKQVLTGAGLGAIKKSPEYQMLDGNAQVKLVTQIEAFQKRNENTPEDQASKFASYWAYASNPEALKGMSDAEILAKTPQLGLVGVKDLLGLKQSLQAPGKVLASNVDTNQLKVFAGQAGMNWVWNSKLTDDQNATMGLLKYRVDQQIESDQQAKGRELTRQEKDDVIRRNLVTFQIQDARGWYNPARWFGDAYAPQDKPAFELQPGDALVVPNEVRKTILDEAKRNGVLNPTEDQIRNRYFQLMQPKPEAAPSLVQRPVRIPMKAK